MKINESKLNEHTGSSFTLKKNGGVSRLSFNETDWIDNADYYAEIFLGKCEGCPTSKAVYDGLSYDKVLVGGLGLGLIPEYLKTVDNCSVVDVVESNNELITWTNSEGFLDDGINIIEGDALNHTPDKKYDLIIIDLWWKESDITEEIKNTLKTKYLSHLNTDGRLVLCLLPEELK